MITMQDQIDAIMELCTAEQEEDRLRAMDRLRLILEGKAQRASDPEMILRQMLLELGAPDHLLGHSFLVEAVLMCLEDRMYIHSITFGLYPQVAAKFDTTASRVERAIRNLVEVTWTRGDCQALRQYFGNTVSNQRYKPTNAEFIARLVNVLRQELKAA